MGEKLLKQQINTYIMHFEKLNADKNASTIKTSAVTTALQNTLNNENIDFPALYAHLHCTHSFFGTNSFEKTPIEKSTLQVFLTFNAFIDVLTKSLYNGINEKTKILIHFLNDYQKESLLPGLLSYKTECLLIEDQQEAKKKLVILDNTFQNLTQLDIEEHRKSCMKKTLNSKDEEHAISQLFGQKITAKAKELAVNNISEIVANDDFNFLNQLKALSHKNNLTYQDVYDLNAASKRFEITILQLPSVKEVTHFHWLINLIVNTLNLFINCFESKKSQQIKSTCRFWQTQWIDVAEKEVKHIDAKIYLR